MATTTTIPTMKISLWSRLLDLIAPRTCTVCSRRLSITENSICTVCNLHLPRIGQHNIPFNDNDIARMFWGLVPVERAAALFYYAAQSDTSNILLVLKYYGKHEVGLDMGKIMADELIPAGFFEGIDLLVPMPLERKRQRERGYNQSEMLAKGISMATGIPYTSKAIERTTFKQSQTRLNKWERMENVSNSFRLLKPELLKGKHILLIDDVITTGATMRSCVEALTEAEGIKISVLALAYAKS